MAEYKQAIAKTVFSATERKMSEKEILASIEVPPNPEMGDYAFPCFKLSALLKENPNKIAASLAEKILPPKGIDKVISNGPYLNFFVTKEDLAKKTIEQVLQEKDKYGKRQTGKKQKVMVEYSAPNSNKPLHIGHLRNNCLGMAISNILETNGFSVTKANMVNDRGIHICKSMLAYQEYGKGSTPEKEGKKPDHFVGDYYVLYNQKVKEKPALEEQAYALLKKWEEKNPATIKLWKQMTNWAVTGFKQTYKEFGSKFDNWFFESQYYNKVEPIIKEAKKKGIFKQNEEGTLVAQLEEFGLPNKTVLRADGTSIYITNDLALTKHKFEKHKLNESIWVVGSEQELYFQQLFKIFELLGFAWAKNCRHLSHGMVNLPSGKLKSREGKVIDADDLIAELELLVKKEIGKRGETLKEKELEARSRAIALSAIKFHMLKVAAQKDIMFNPKESISFEGETGPYIQYTYARAKSILEKAGKANIKKFDTLRLTGPEEQKIIKLLASYPAQVEKSLKQLSPHVICQFLIELAESFNTFYHKHSVLQAGSDEIKNERLVLVQATAQVLKNGLSLLDIEAIEKM